MRLPAVPRLWGFTLLLVVNRWLDQIPALSRLRQRSQRRLEELNVLGGPGPRASERAVESSPERAELGAPLTSRNRREGTEPVAVCARSGVGEETSYAKSRNEHPILAPHFGDMTQSRVLAQAADRRAGTPFDGSMVDREFHRKRARFRGRAAQAKSSSLSEAKRTIARGADFVRQGKPSDRSPDEVFERIEAKLLNRT